MFLSKIRISYSFVLVLLLFNQIPQNGFSQVHYTDGLYWLRFQTNIKWDSPWSASLQLEERRFHSPDRAHQRVLPELQLHYNPKAEHEFYLSYLNFTIAFPQTADLPLIEAVNEQRFGLAYVYTHKLDSYQLGFKTLNEYRLFDSNPNDGDLNYIPFRMRWRNEISCRVALSEKWGLFLAEELHLNWAANQKYQVFDQNRISLGFRYKINSDLFTELDYIHWYQKNRSGTEFYNRHILRFTMMYFLRFTNRT